MMATEKRLIDANTLIEWIDMGHLRNPLETCFSERDVVDMLESRPSVDAVEVVHGRWLSWEEQFPDKVPRRKNNLGVFCNKCTNHADNRTDYCPNCGARMDFEDNE